MVAIQAATRFNTRSTFLCISNPIQWPSYEVKFATATAVAAWDCVSTQNPLQYCDEVLSLLLQQMAVVAAICWY